MAALFGFARKPAPTHCPDCNSKLGPLDYGIKYDLKYKVISPINEGYWRECRCGCFITWSYPNVWKRRHRLPILDMPNMRDIIQNTDGNL